MMISVVLSGVILPSNGQAYGSPGIVGIKSLRCLIEPLAVAARRRWKPAGCAVDVQDLGLPRQPITAGGQIVHVGVRAILRAAANGREAAVTELVDVVLDRPMPARFAHQVGPHFRGNDFIRSAAG